MIYNNNSQIPNSFCSNGSWFELSNETLQEPVPFEDFKFSLGINSDFSAAANNAVNDMMMDSFTTFMSNNTPTEDNNTVLDENDQKAFSSFLDAFFMDSDMQFNNSSATNSNNHNEEQEEGEHRRSSILQSLDEQKVLHQRLNLIASLPSPSSASASSASEDDTTHQSIYLRASDSITLPYSSNNSNNTYHYNQQQQQSQTSTPKRRSSLTITEKNTAAKKVRTNKELLTEEEKRANHIASEQKRRSTIRNGFKDLTDLIPTLKNVNNSKSTVLFKAVDFIHHLEQRNKELRDKVGSLELRVEVEGHMTQSSPTTVVVTKEVMPGKVSSPSTAVTALVELNTIKQHHNNTSFLPTSCFPPSINYNHLHQQQSRKIPTHNSHSNNNHLPANARNALLAHKTQQKQLLILQEQLQMHQRLIAQQQEMKGKSLLKSNKLPPILGQYESNSK